jgi:plastocyanin
MAGFGRTSPGTVVLGLGIVLVGCGGGGGGNSGPPTTVIAKASTNSGDAQTGVVGQPLPLPLTVVVTEGGAASAGATVTWSATGVGSSLNPASAATDANGNASSVWTLGDAAGAQTARATLTGASGSPVTFQATAMADGANTLAIAGGDNQTGQIGAALPAPLQAQVTDQFGNGVPGVAVVWAATGASVSAGSVPTDASGISAVTVTMGGTAGPVTITATATNLNGSPVTFNATAVVQVPLPTSAAVTVGNDFFTSVHNGTSNPAVDTVAVGGRVTWTWTNTGGIRHSVQSLGNPGFSSSQILSGNGQTYSFTFTAPGVYQYDCAVHLTAMTGRIVVK